MNNTVGQVVTVITAIIGVAMLAVLVGRNARTSEVISSAGDAVSDMLRAATGPVTGQF